MVYFGEEVGEKGMEAEGFSGLNGRTTIFDWWSVASVRRLRKLIASGEYRSLEPERIAAAGLNHDEAAFFCRFAEALRYAASDLAVGKGTTYDLCYCNSSSDGFDKNRHFAFLRDYHDHTILVVANFSNQEARMQIVIPDHAFDWMGIPVTEEFYPGKVIEVVSAPMDATIITLI